MNEPGNTTVRELLAEAFEKPPADRPAFLERACAGDARLRSEVQALLASLEQAGEFLNAATADHPTPPPGGEGVLAHGVRPSAGEQPGARIGRYKLLQQIGEGGFGTVFMAEQEHPVRRRVALKIIKLGMDTRQVVARFEAERQALAMMDHPNIARVLDAGATDNGRPYFVMELVKGVPIVEYCDKHNVSTRERLGLFVQVCRAVQHAHQKGIIHRDIKPSNILVTLADGLPIPKVIDFGIAKATQSRLTEKTLFTEYRQLVGTPAYMSPEQAEMSGVDIDTRSDIYSLGVLLYELLTGTTPFSAEELRAKAYGEIQRIIREVEPPRPSTRLSTLGDSLASVAAHRRTEPARLRRLVRGELDWIVMRCLEKDRTRRYDTANGLAVDVERYLRDEPVVARPATAGYRVAKFARRHKVGAAATVGVAAALIVAVVGTSVGLVRANAARQRAAHAEGEATRQKEAALRLLGEVQQAKADAERQARRAGVAFDYLQNMFSAARPVGATAPGTASTKPAGLETRLVDVLETAARRLDQLGEQPEVELDLRLTLARTYESLAVYDQARLHYTRAQELARAVGGPESEQAMQVTADLLFVFSRDADTAAPSMAMARDAAATARRVLGENHPITQDTLNALGLIMMACQDTAGAEEVLSGLVRRVREGVPAGPKGSARFLNNLSLLVRQQGRLAEAEQLEREAVELARTEGDLDARRLGTYRVNLAQTLWQQNKLGESERVFREVVEHGRRTLGEAHPDTLMAQFLLGALLQQRGDWQAALDVHQDFLKHVRSAGVGDAAELDSYFTLAELLLRCGKEQQAAAAFADAVARLRQAAAKEPALDVAARKWWAQAELFVGLRIDRPWAGTAVRTHAAHAAWRGLLRRSWGDPPVGSVDWSQLRFRIDPWAGDPPPGRPATAPAPAGGLGPIQGGLRELWATADPPPGVYLLSFTLPRRGAAPVREAQWMWVTPWQVSLHMPTPFDRAEEGKWDGLFKSAPAERRLEPSLVFHRFGQAAAGFGPSRLAEAVNAEATTTADLPYGKYRLHVNHDGGCRLWMDGKTLVNNWESGTTGTVSIDATDGRPAEMTLRWADGTFQLLVELEPVGAAAHAMIQAVVPPLDHLVADAERLAAQASRNPPQPHAVFDHGLMLARLGRFDEAAREMSRAIQLEPKQDFWAYVRTTLLAYQNDPEAHRAAAADGIRRFGASSQPELRERLVKSAAARPGAADPAVLVELADFAVKADPNHQYMAWFKLGKAMAEYRAGHDEAAAAAGADAAAGLAPLAAAGLGRATCHYVRAMALHRLGRRDESRAAYAEGEREFAAADRVPGRDDLGDGGIENWFVSHTVRREARGLLGIEPAATRPLTRPATQPATGQEGRQAAPLRRVHK